MGTPMRGIAGKVALVTGAASGIGAATARRFAAEGAKVVVVDLNGDGAEEVAASIRAAGGVASAFAADVADPAASCEMVRHAVATHGGLDVLDNNATSGTMGRRATGATSCAVAAGRGARRCVTARARDSPPKTRCPTT